DEGSYALAVTSGRQLTCKLGLDYAGGEVELGRWTHLACSYDGAAVRLYVDGALVASTPKSGILSIVSTEDTYLGSNYPAGDGFRGVLDDTRVWAHARSEGALCRVAASSPAPFVPPTPACELNDDGALTAGCDAADDETGLVLCYDFDNDFSDEGFNATIDGSGENNFGWIQGTATTQAGYHGLARHFDGQTSIVVAEAESLDVSAVT